MEVIRASALGMCFGVRDALEVVERIEQPGRVTIHGELVHNEEVLARLNERGFRATPEAHRAAIPASPEVLITAHGVSDRERRRLESAGKTLIDATCPLVTLVHEAAQRLHREGFFLIVIGRQGHVEVEGITGDLGRFTVVQSAEEVACYDAERLGIVCQSTTPPFEAAIIRQAIEARNPGKVIRFADTICRPTRERQQAVLDLVEQVEAVVVVGGSHSNNTRQLARLAASRGRPVLHVRNVADLDPEWFAAYRVVGLTAGTSTLDRTVDEVHRALIEMPAGVPAVSAV
ncbi:MAG TPA: 4-hydroxy-3-methylbut-2-enyl diphosphate reductase [Isosphaeraceae bacterium]|jgi:4-hydroxy-3-methylbut-2-enyl diphosphate reductase|nr:4-hydroxy-3-methylbut-2-enyl diphosphate reductase [Isosphaeraceae bacterium]